MTAEKPLFQDIFKSVPSKFDRNRSELIPMLQYFQNQVGYLPEELISAAAEYLKLSESTVYSVASFYTQFKFQPPGRNSIKVCCGTACHVGGGERIIDELQRHLQIKPGETTPDLEYSLDTVACMGACALAPVILVNDEIHGRTTAARVLDAVTKKQKLGKGCKCR